MEILSPAGDFDSLRAAVQNGADAVYVGGADFSARRSAKNFDNEELERAIDYCHLRGSKLYVACNTLIKEQELSEVTDFLEKIYIMGADAVIVQDLGLMSLLKNNLPELPVHASTQMTVTNTNGANVLKDDYGVKRVVLARELSFDDIAEIRKNTKAEIEVFVHGALCMSYSGQCLFSSVLGGRSGNRGACAQPCRLSYTLMEGDREVTDNIPLLSLKDLCLADEIYKLNKLGIDSLKIEGRMKSPEYVAQATRVYSEAAKIGTDKKEIEKLLSLFSRGGAGKGYFYGRTFDDMMSYKEGSKISADKETKNEVKKSYSGENMEIPINMFFYGAMGEEMQLTISDENGRCVSVSGEKMVKAENRPLDKDRIEQQLRKLGGTPFKADYVEIITDGGTVAIKDINSLRREAIEKFTGELCASKKRASKEIIYKKEEWTKSEELKINIEVTTKEQYEVVKDTKDAEIFVPYNLYKEINPENAVCILPPILKDSDKIDLGGIEKVEINNIGHLALCKGKKIYAGYSMNICNSSAFDALKKAGAEQICLSSELTLNEIRNVLSGENVRAECVGYGRQRLMYMENCVIKSAYGCKCKGSNFYLKDRLGVKFPIIAENCRNVLLNSRPIYMADKESDIKNLQINALRLIFTVENPDLCCIIIDAYKKMLEGTSEENFNEEFTRGHFYRGAQ